MQLTYVMKITCTFGIGQARQWRRFTLKDEQINTTNKSQLVLAVEQNIAY